MIKRQKILGIYNPDALPRPAALQASREPSTAEVGSEDSDSDSDDAQGEGGYEEFQQLVNVPVLPEEADHPAIEVGQMVEKQGHCCQGFVCPCPICSFDCCWPILSFVYSTKAI